MTGTLGLSPFQQADTEIALLEQALRTARLSRARLVANAAWPWDDLQMMGYQALLLDPPWRYVMRTKNGYEKSPEAHYPTMTDEEILNLPVGALASDDCLMVLWCIWPKIDLAVRCVDHWGFKLITGGAWFKRTESGKPRMGPGYTMRSVCEPFLIARLGKPQVRLTDLRNALGDNIKTAIPIEELASISLQGIAREHSRKPPEMRTLVERMTPNARRAELFAREPWAGNEVWGNQTTLFSDQPQAALETDHGSGSAQAGQFALFDAPELDKLAS
jgi:N6-adenosine-specific RNA methylase IME4